MKPLVVVAGFLGAGKTSFLRRWLPLVEARGPHARVILNDFENARLDAATLKDVAPVVVPVSGSCLCCDTQDALLAALGDARTTEGFDAVVVEANGTTDTGALLELLTETRGFEDLSWPLQITMVDALRFGQRGWQNEMERDQIATATHVMLSRLDVVDAARAAAVTEAVRAIAPRAAFVSDQNFADVVTDLAFMLKTEPPRRRDVAPRAPAKTNGAHEAQHHFASFQVPLPGAVDPAAFEAFLRALPPEILRAKGVVLLTDPPEKRSFHKVDQAVEISPCQLADPDEVEPAAVFIGTGAPVMTVRARLARLFKNERA